MDANYVLACGVVWRKTADPDAGWELIYGLKSADPGVRNLAQALLLENGRESMLLIELAVATGELSPEVAGPCMAEILRFERADKVNDRPTQRGLFDATLC